MKSQSEIDAQVEADKARGLPGPPQSPTDAGYDEDAHMELLRDQLAKRQKKPRAKSGISLGSLPASWHGTVAILCDGTALSPAKVTAQIREAAQGAAQIRATEVLSELTRKYKGGKNQQSAVKQ